MVRGTKGVGTLSLSIAFAHRHGPGMVCWQTSTAAGCDEYLDPGPWAIAGFALVVAGFVAQARGGPAGTARPCRRSMTAKVAKGRVAVSRVDAE